MTLIIIGAVIAFIVIALVAMYNKFVALRARVDKGWKDIDVQLQRRFDLIPNLVNTVKGYAEHEKGTLEEIAKMRSKYEELETNDVKGKAELTSKLSQGLNSLMVQVENYPDLKASQNFLSLQEELTSTENKISYARQFYNDIVTKYNTAVQMFPGNIIAGMFAFKSRELFEVESEEVKKNVKVEF